LNQNADAGYGQQHRQGPTLNQQVTSPWRERQQVTSPWRETTGYESLERKTTGNEPLERETTGYESLERETTGYESLERETTGYEPLYPKPGAPKEHVKVQQVGIWALRAPKAARL